MCTEKKLNFGQVKDKALRYLEYRAHSEYELYLKLKRAGADDKDLEGVMEFLREYRFVDDKEFSLKCARDMKNLKKFGKKRVRAELMKKGIAHEYIENAIEEIEWEDEDILYPMVKKKLSGDFERKSIERCIRYFSYRGYGFEEIKSMIEKIKAEEEYGI